MRSNFPQLLSRGRRDLDFEQMHHGAVFGPRDRFEGEDRSSQLVAAEQSAQCDSARHRIGVGVILEHNRDAIALVDQSAKFADFLPGERLIHRIDPRQSVIPRGLESSNAASSGGLVLLK